MRLLCNLFTRITNFLLTKCDLCLRIFHLNLLTKEGLGGHVQLLLNPEDKTCCGVLWELE